MFFLIWKLVTLNDSEIIWDRKIEGSFPEAKVLKQRIRDHVNPLKNLGHSDINGKKQKGEITSATTDSCTDCDDKEFKLDSQELDDAEAADLRRHFGVMWARDRFKYTCGRELNDLCVLNLQFSYHLSSNLILETNKNCIT